MEKYHYWGLVAPNKILLEAMVSAGFVYNHEKYKQDDMYVGELGKNTIMIYDGQISFFESGQAQILIPEWAFVLVESCREFYKERNEK